MVANAQDPKSLRHFTSHNRPCLKIKQVPDQKPLNQNKTFVLQTIMELRDQLHRELVMAILSGGLMNPSRTKLTQEENEHKPSILV